MLRPGQHQQICRRKQLANAVCAGVSGLALTFTGCASSRVDPFAAVSSPSHGTVSEEQAEAGTNVATVAAGPTNNRGIALSAFDEALISTVPADDQSPVESTNPALSPQTQAPPAGDQTDIIPIASQDPVKNNESLEYFVRTALARHPEILAAQQRVAAATNVIPQARALPDPNFNNTFWPFQDQALQTAAGRVGNQMSINQMVPFPKKLNAKAAIASREVQMAQAEVDRISREITELVRLAYYEVWFATRAMVIIDETKGLVSDLTEVAAARYRSGGSQQDVLRAQLETDRLDDQLVSLRKQQRMAQADLAALLQEPVGLVPETSDQLDADSAPENLESLIALAEQCNPSLRGLAWEIQRDRERQQLACLQQYPDMTVGLNWGLVSDGRNVISPVANGHDNLSFSIGTTLPIWHDKISAGIREASHRTSSTVRRLDAERDKIYGKLRRLLAQADALIEQRDIYRDRIIPRTEDTLKLSIADYRGKRADFFSLIETYRELLMFETQLARIEATLAGTVAQIDRVVGCPF